MKTHSSDYLPINFELTDDIKKAFDIIEYTDRSVFITGRAGTGKSTLIEYFRINTKKEVVYLAPTGVTALSIRGKTVHSFFKFPSEVITYPLIKGNTYSGNKISLFNNIDTIVIDEISMARADLIDGIDYILKRFRRRNGDVFGGVQMIFIGDVYQLPPFINKLQTANITLKNGEVLTQTSLFDYFQDKYKGPYFFDSPAFKKGNFIYFEMETVFRQRKDNDFLNILNAIRDNEIDDKLLSKLNTRYFQEIGELESNTIILCTTNNCAYEINKQKMEALRTKKIVYKATISGSFESEIKESNYPVPEYLELKEKAQVMMVKNDKDGRWVNGTVGIIDKLTDSSVFVKINRHVYPVPIETWQNIEYIYDLQEETLATKILGEYKQYPIKLAWASTIHRSQGKTFDKVLIDFSIKPFAHGQTYVALSRCRTLNGIILKQLIDKKDISVKYDNRVKYFVVEMKKNNQYFDIDYNNDVLF